MNAHSEFRKDQFRHTLWVKRPNMNRIANSDLAAAAAEAIEILTTVPQETIKVTARHGWLHLEGTLNWQHQRTTVEDVVRHLPGVQGVTDSIIIQSIPTQTEAVMAFR